MKLQRKYNLVVNLNFRVMENFSDWGGRSKNKTSFGEIIFVIVTKL